jgi:hypothetical protein
MMAKDSRAKGAKLGMRGNCPNTNKFFFEAGFGYRVRIHYAAQAVLELAILLPRHPEC